MKIFKFIMKYINHNDSKKICFDVTIKCDWEPTWTHNENDLSEYKKWLISHVDWEHALKQKVKETLKELHKDFDFDSYRLKAVKSEKEGCMKNLNHDDESISTNDIRFKKVKWMELSKCVHTKGSANSNMKKINYPKLYFSHVFVFKSAEGDKNIVFDQVCSYDLKNTASTTKVDGKAIKVDGKLTNVETKSMTVPSEADDKTVGSVNKDITKKNAPVLNSEERRDFFKTLKTKQVDSHGKAESFAKKAEPLVKKAEPLVRKADTQIQQTIAPAIQQIGDLSRRNILPIMQQYGDLAKQQMGQVGQMGQIQMESSQTMENLQNELSKRQSQMRNYAEGALYNPHTTGAINNLKGMMPGMSVQNIESQRGGNDDDYFKKYMKYKIKYYDAKNSLNN